MHSLKQRPSQTICGHAEVLTRSEENNFFLAEKLGQVSALNLVNIMEKT